MSVQKYFRVVCNSCGLELDAPASLDHTEQQFIARIRELGWKLLPATALTAPAWICSAHTVREVV